MLFLRVRCNTGNNTLGRSYWMRPFCFANNRDTISKAKSAMLRFNGSCEVWHRSVSARTGNVRMTLLASNHIL